MRISVGVLIWLVLLGACLIYELVCWYQHFSEFPTFTRMVVNYVPAPVTLFFFVWVYFHFLNAYLKK